MVTASYSSVYTCLDHNGILVGMVLCIPGKFSMELIFKTFKDLMTPLKLKF